MAAAERSFLVLSPYFVESESEEASRAVDAEDLADVAPANWAVRALFDARDARDRVAARRDECVRLRAEADLAQQRLHSKRQEATPRAWIRCSGDGITCAHRSSPNARRPGISQR
eukprot:1711996-Pleurochrysis_carterae.AAC.1